MKRNRSSLLVLQPDGIVGDRVRAASECEGGAMQKVGKFGLLVAAVLAMCGCKGGSAPLQPVTGKVTYHGTLVQTGVIVFTPDTARGGSGPLALGQIRPDGTYTLKTG